MFNLNGFSAVLFLSLFLSVSTLPLPRHALSESVDTVVNVPEGVASLRTATTHATTATTGSTLKKQNATNSTATTEAFLNTAEAFVNGSTLHVAGNATASPQQFLNGSTLHTWNASSDANATASVWNVSIATSMNTSSDGAPPHQFLNGSTLHTWNASSDANATASVWNVSIATSMNTSSDGAPPHQFPNGSTSHYQTLQLDRNAATPKLIKRAMRKLAFTYYGKDDAMFQDVVVAYETLIDPFLKETYDRDTWNASSDANATASVWNVSIATSMNTSNDGAPPQQFLNGSTLHTWNASSDAGATPPHVSAGSVSVSNTKNASANTVEMLFAMVFTNDTVTNMTLNESFILLDARDVSTNYHRTANNTGSTVPEQVVFFFLATNASEPDVRDQANVTGGNLSEPIWWFFLTNETIAELCNASMNGTAAAAAAAAANVTNAAPLLRNASSLNHTVVVIMALQRSLSNTLPLNSSRSKDAVLVNAATTNRTNGTSAMAQAKNNGKDGTECSCNSMCGSGVCRGGHCCNAKGRTKGCETCDLDGDCARCKSGYFLHHYTCYERSEISA